MAEFHISPSPKKAKVDTFSTDICVFCPETNDEKLSTPQLSRIDTLFDACKASNDEVGKKLLQHESKVQLPQELQKFIL